MGTYQDFHSQTVESASCRLVDSREPRCYEPPEKDTGRVINQFFFRHSYIYLLAAERMKAETICSACVKG